MYLLYLDDSGSVPNRNENYFVLGGVCVPERSLQWLTNRLEDLAKQIDPSNPSQVEFHASEIFSGKIEPWKSFKRQDRIEIIKKVLHVLDEAYEDVVLFACAVHKASFSENPVEMAFEDLCSRFDLYLDRLYRNNGESHKGLIIFDKSSYENALQVLSRHFRDHGTRWRSLKHIREVPFFVDSKVSRIIQLADHISYAVFRRYNAGDLTYFNCIENRFDSEGERIHGLVHKQTYNPDCTCPACYSRRVFGSDH